MPTNTPFWSWCPMPGMARTKRLNVDTNSYGDGYNHRVTRGINPLRPEWALSFPFTSQEVLKEMDDFLAENAVRGFWFQPPGETEEILVTVDEWSAAFNDKNLTSGYIGTMQATFIENFNQQPISPTHEVDVEGSLMKSINYIKSQTKSRSPYKASTIGTASTINRHYAGPWSGTFTNPINMTPSVPYSPVMLQGPQWFPIEPHVETDFTGIVDMPFASLDGWVGHRQMVNPTPPPPFIDDPTSMYADSGVNWGSYFILASCEGVKQFIAKIGANLAWAANMADPPPGQWSFQVITYASQADHDADANRILVGNPWLEADRPGDVRNYYSQTYVPQTPTFTDVVFSTAIPWTIDGVVSSFTMVTGRTYQILVTDESDVEYAYNLHPIAGPGAFHIATPDYQAPGGPYKLRLCEQLNGATVRIVGQCWTQEIGDGTYAFPDLRVEHRLITDIIPVRPTAILPAYSDFNWFIGAIPGDGSISRISLVSANTKRVFGEFTMPSGLARSFIVPPIGAGQSRSDTYYDAFNDTCFLYDQAVALIAFLTAGEKDAAVAMVDALLTVQNADGSFPFAIGQAAIYERNPDFIRTGAVAWVCYALLLCDLPQFRPWFLPSNATHWPALSCLTYITTYVNSLGLLEGGKGQYVDYVLDPSYVVPWWSCEHNIDAWWCYDLAYVLYGDPPHRAAADAIKASLLTTGVGWDDTKEIFWQGGIVTAGVNAPDGMHALDTHTWGAILMQKWNLDTDSAHSLARAKAVYWCADRATGLRGYTTFSAVDGYPADTIPTPWYEGSFGAVCAERGNSLSNATNVLYELVRGQRANGSYLYALQQDPVNGINNWPCIIGPAWNVLAMSGPGTIVTRLLWPVD